MNYKGTPITREIPRVLRLSSRNQGRRPAKFIIQQLGWWKSEAAGYQVTCPPLIPSAHPHHLPQRGKPWSWERIKPTQKEDEMRHGQWKQALATQADFFNAALSLPVIGVSKSQLLLKLHGIKSLSLEIKKKKLAAFPSGAYHLNEGWHIQMKNDMPIFRQQFKNNHTFIHD